MLFSNPEYLIIQQLYIPMGARLKELFCINLNSTTGCSNWRSIYGIFEQGTFQISSYSWSWSYFYTHAM